MKSVQLWRERSTGQTVKLTYKHENGTDTLVDSEGASIMDLEPVREESGAIRSSPRSGIEV